MLQPNAWRLGAAGALAIIIALVIMNLPHSTEGDREDYVVRLRDLPALPIAQPSFQAPSNAIAIEPGQDIQKAVESHPNGTTFLLKAGTHRMQSIVPSNNDTFIGEPGAVLNGARVLDNIEREGKVWVAGDVADRGQAAGYCSPGYDACQFPEDLFIGNEMLRRVAHRIDVGPGRWYFDYLQHKVYIGDDPGDRLVELSVTRAAFSGQAKNVTIQGLRIEKYAQPGQFAAVDGSEGQSWRIEANEMLFNHAAAIEIGSNSTVRGNLLHHNGQLGVKGGGDNSTIEGNVIAYNNIAGFDAGWEAGGGKFSHTYKLTVRNNVVTNNDGCGFWTDIDNRSVVFEDNVIRDNTLRGIFHEISYEAVIRNNKLSGNGLGFDTWLWGGQIVIANSSNAEVYGNDVTVPDGGGDGIALIQANRGAGKFGELLTKNNYVHDNQIHYLGTSGQSGAAADYDEKGMLSANNRFDRNHYYTTDTASHLWNWQGDLDWQGFKSKGQEANGSLTILSPEESRARAAAAKP